MANPQIISTSEPIAGTAFVTIDGATLVLGARCTWSVAKVERTSKIGLSGVYGYVEKPRACFIELSGVDRGSLTVEDFSGKIASGVQVELVNSKMVTGSNMWTTTASEVDAAEGDFTVRFEGGTVQELPTG